MASLAKRRDTLVADVQFCRFLLPVPWSAIQRPLGLPQPLMGTDLLAKSGKRPALSKLANLSDHDCRAGKIDTAKSTQDTQSPRAMHGEEEHDDLDLMACCELNYDTVRTQPQ